jgi:hypothetical protein
LENSIYWCSAAADIEDKRAMAAAVIAIFFMMSPIDQAKIDKPSLSYRRKPVHLAGPNERNSSGGH